MLDIRQRRHPNCNLPQRTRIHDGRLDAPTQPRAKPPARRARQAWHPAKRALAPRRAATELLWHITDAQRLLSDLLPDATRATWNRRRAPVPSASRLQTLALDLDRADTDPGPASAQAKPDRSAQSFISCALAIAGNGGPTAPPPHARGQRHAVALCQSQPRHRAALQAAWSMRCCANRADRVEGWDEPADPAKVWPKLPARPARWAAYVANPWSLAMEAAHDAAQPRLISPRADGDAPKSGRGAWAARRIADRQSVRLQNPGADHSAARL